MAYIDRIRACTAHDLSRFVPWRVGGDVLGWVTPRTAGVLATESAAFREAADGTLEIQPALTDSAGRTRAVEGAVDRLIAAGILPGRRGERYPVLRRWGESPLFDVDRGAAVHLGIKSFGCHVNGLVRRQDGFSVWVGRRAAGRAVAPGKLDHLVAGGQPAGLTLEANLIKECAEEADVPEALARSASPVGAVTYTMEAEGGLRRDVLFIYDLWLPEGFTPRNTDGEVAAFELWPVERLAERVRDTDDFKFNVGPVIIDLLIRHGVIGPEEPDYVEMIQALRSPVDFPA